MSGVIKNNRIIKRIFVACMDVICVYFSAYFALLLRFDLKISNVNPEFLEALFKYVPFVAVETVLVFAIFRLYNSLWSYAGFNELQNILVGSFTASFVQFLVLHVFLKKDSAYLLPRSYYFLFFVFLFLSAAGIRFVYRTLRLRAIQKSTGGKKIRVMLIGAGDSGHMILREIAGSAVGARKVVCIIDDDPAKKGSYVHGVKVVGGREKIIEAAAKYNVSEIIIAIPSASRHTISEIANICKDTECNLKITPSLDEIVNGQVSVSVLRSVSVEDLLGREPVRVDIDSIMGYVTGKTILITGGGGSIGSEIARQVATKEPKRLIIVDIYENNAYDIQNELKMTHPELTLTVLIASVRNKARIDSIFETYRPDIVFHAAAHKHVPLMEDSPGEAIKNNVFGTFNTASAADRFGAKRFVLISTDKAVNPTSVMGASKRICEMIIQTFARRSKTEFVAVRFGNVLGSNGSVIPLFKKQIAAGGPVTVTHPDIIRYFMTIPEAVSLVLQAGAYAKGGEIFVLEMGEPVKILDLATNLIKLSGLVPGEDIKIEFTGLRPGEKLYEELLMAEEGMKDTANKLIHIGRPIEMDEENFFEKLTELKEFVEKEPDGESVRKCIKELVPTYILPKKEQ